MGAIQREERGEDWGRGERKAQNAHKEERVATSTSLFFISQTMQSFPRDNPKELQARSYDTLNICLAREPLDLYKYLLMIFSSYETKSPDHHAFSPLPVPFPPLHSESTAFLRNKKYYLCGFFFFHLNSHMILPCFYSGSKLYQGMFEGCANPQRDYRMNKFESYALNKELEAKICHNEKLN